MVADNDLALGRIVEGISRSRFWKETLVLVIEDDSQSGLDHVDGHRTVAFCISPYTRRGVVVSEPYNHTSFLRTIELVLGMPAMTRFDRTATPLTACFKPTPDLQPYTRLPNRVPLDEMNPAPSTLKGEARRLAEACARLDWSDLDRADATTLARAMWLAGKPKTPFPWRQFHPNLSKDADDH
jgi:phospholipase C